MNRRDFLASLVLWPSCRPQASQRDPAAVVVNDLHSQLNPTRVRGVVKVDSTRAVRDAVAAARREGVGIAVSGARHAMGAQQFATDAMLLDLRGLNRIGRLDARQGTIEVESGVQWPELIAHLIETQRGRSRQWGIAQKQTGADRLTIGGALAANAHGRGLRMKPMIDDVESFVLIDGGGRARRCSRRENAELFRLAIGGYGLFGVIASVTLRLAPRRNVQRVVDVRTIDGLTEAFEQRLADGFLYGDFQFSIDEKSDDFLRRGVFSCYRPVEESTPIAERQSELSDKDWRDLILLAHADKAKAFERYASHYLTTSGQVYWSDTHQLSTYFDDYHRALDPRSGTPGESARATEIITEIYSPRPLLAGFMAEAAEMLRRNGPSVIYGTIRLIERDAECFLAWAKDRYACVIFNLHTVHTPEGIERSAQAFRGLIDLAIKRKGSYFLTYHKYASRAQVEACYPQFPEFLRLKRQYDPEERFQSDWYRHYKNMFGGSA